MYVKLEKNTPTTVALKSPAYEKVSGQFGPQARFQLLDGRDMYLNLPTADYIVKLGIKPGEPFTITKAQRPDGRNWEWRVERKSAQPAAQFLDNGESLEEYGDSLMSSAPQTQLECALKTAVSAAAAAEKHASDVGYTCRFTPADVRSMAISVLIGMQTQGRSNGAAR